MGSTFDRDWRKRRDSLNRQDNGIKEAIRNCQRGNFEPKNGEEGLTELLEFVGYKPGGSSKDWDRDKLHELEHDFDLSEAEMTIIEWHLQALAKSEEYDDSDIY